MWCIVDSLLHNFNWEPSSMDLSIFRTYCFDLARASVAFHYNFFTKFNTCTSRQYSENYEGGAMTRCLSPSLFSLACTGCLSNTPDYMTTHCMPVFF